MFTELPDLAAERFGGAVIEANDEFFAPKDALIKRAPPEWREGLYTERGKWMDGWETRRRRSPGHDWAIIRLGFPGIVHGVVIDTSFFTGNYPEYASLEACEVGNLPSSRLPVLPSFRWRPLLPKTKLAGNTKNVIAIKAKARRVSHLRLNIFPDGGVARLRVHGEVVPEAARFENGREVDLAALENGALVIACSDMHYGNPLQLIQPGRATHMGDGWETRRRRGPGHDWSIIRLARRGVIERVELDTDHFKGNAPGSAMLELAEVNGSFDPTKAAWKALLRKSPLEPNARHQWGDLRARPATHVRLNIYPDGGVARLRLLGRVTA